MSDHSYPSPSLFRALVCPESMTSGGLTFHKILGCILILIIVCFLLERERGILLKRLLDASPGEERTELLLDMCYSHGFEMEEVKEARQKMLEKMWMGQPV